MGVRFTAAHGVYWNYGVHKFAAGDELPAGELANYLLTGGAPVEETEAAPAVDTDPNSVPDGSIATVLLWVGDNSERATKALDTERDKGDGARVGLVAALEKQLSATPTY